MKRPDFVDGFKNRWMVFFSGFKGLLPVTGIKIPTQILGYLTGDHYGPPPLFTQKCIDSLN
jgi:hypothetical protein